MSEMNKNSNYKWSRVDLEVEKLKIQSDIEAEGEKYGFHKELILDNALDDLAPYGENIYESSSVNEILNDWDSFIDNDYYDIVATLQALENDEEKIKLSEKYINNGDDRAYGEFMGAIAMSLSNDELKHDVIKKIDNYFCNLDTSDTSNLKTKAAEIKHTLKEANNLGYNNYTEESLIKTLRDVVVSHIVSTLKDPNSIIQYYEGMDDIYAKNIVLQELSHRELYRDELSTEELQEVSSRMKEEVSKAEALNAQTRAGLEEEIMAALRSLTKAKQEYTRLTKQTSKEDLDDLLDLE